MIDVSEEVEELAIDVDAYITPGSAAVTVPLIPDEAISNKAIDITDAVPLVTRETTPKGTQTLVNNASSTRRNHDSKKPGARKQSPSDVTDNVPRAKKQKCCTQ